MHNILLSIWQFLIHQLSRTLCGIDRLTCAFSPFYAEERLTGLLTRRRQIVDMLTVEKNRLQTVRVEM